jgi:hypothetical protein
MISVHFANHVSVAMLKHPIQELDFFFPATVGPMLLIREQEVLAAIENSIRGSSCLDSIHRAATIGWEILRPQLRTSTYLVGQGGG